MNLQIRSRLFIENDQMQHSIPASHSKVEFCGVQKQKGKLVFSKSGIFHVWHIVSVAEDQNVVGVARQRHEIHVIKISVSPENRKMEFSKHFPRAKSVP